MTTVREYIQEPGTNNKADNTTVFEDAEAAVLFYNNLVERYDNSNQWTFKAEEDGIRVYSNNLNSKITCELSNK